MKHVALLDREMRDIIKALDEYRKAHPEGTSRMRKTGDILANCIMMGEMKRYCPGIPNRLIGVDKNKSEKTSYPKRNFWW